ncbi:sugar ABC transporter permease [Streptomyces sp. NPDC057565]|uniref:sugar ABC transporter permease n=1 Tax=Streptomyces sp. NPDC057565 TaxID=3346169 RepID=UPI003674D5FE
MIGRDAFARIRAVRDGNPITADRGNAPPGTAAGRQRSASARGITDRVGVLWHRLAGGEPRSLLAVLLLVVIWVVSEFLKANFLSPRNLSILSLDIVGTGMLAVGLVFVLLLGQIDLSLGAVSGLAAALFAVLSVYEGVPEPVAVIIALLCGAAVGSLHGFFIAKVGAPSFAITLAGFLAWSGLALVVLGPNGTVNLDDQGLVASLTSTYFSNVAAAYGLAVLSTALFLFASCHDRRRRRAAGVPFRSLSEIAWRAGALAAAAFAAAWVLNQFQGLPLALLIFLVIVAGLDRVLRRTSYGRTVRALGSNAEAARRAGVNVTRTRISVFAISGTMAALGGLFLASRITSVSQTSGSSVLLINAIAAAVIGGTSLFGGRGRPWSAFLGVLVIQSIASSMVLVGIPTAVQFLVTGVVLLVVLVVDTLSRHSQKEHGRA